MEKENHSTEALVAGQTAPVAVISNELSKIIEECSVQGLNGAILVFMRKRGLAASNERATKFADAITAEFGPGGVAEAYPLSKSIASPVRGALEASLSIFKELHDAGEEENLRKLIRVIVAGEMMNVMQDCLEEVMKVYNDLK